MKNVAYAIGGFDGMNCHSSVEYYEPQRDRWFIMSNNMTSRVSYPSKWICVRSSCTLQTYRILRKSFNV